MLGKLKKLDSYLQKHIRYSDMCSLGNLELQGHTCQHLEKGKKRETYRCCCWFIEDNIVISDCYYPGFPVNFITPWEAFGMHMDPQVCAGLKALVGVRHPERLLRLPHRLPFNGRPPAQDRRLRHLPKDSNMLRGSVRRRLRRDKGVIYGPKLDEICNVQRREAEGPGDEIGGGLVFPRNEVLDSWRVVL